MAQAVPIQNLYYLFCYAWGHFREGKGLAVDATIGPNTFDLLATVLINGVRRLLRRGIDRGYVAFEEDLRHPRPYFVWYFPKTSSVHKRARKLLF
jgi:5-methylcytosine-specific restriction enzyme subunit McrC